MPTQRSIFDFQKEKVSSYVDLTQEPQSPESSPPSSSIANDKIADFATYEADIDHATIKTESSTSLNDGEIKKENETVIKPEAELVLEPIHFVKETFCSSIKSEIHNDDDCGVTCPVCGITLDLLSFESRITHVEMCLTPKPPLKRSSINPIPKKRKLVAESDKYKNSQIDLTKEKIIKPPTSIKRRKNYREIPDVKILLFGNIRIAVDAFCYSHESDIEHYFLTHFHSDHYGGISKGWCYERVFETDEISDDKYKKIIYCTPITSKLLTLKFSVDPRFIQELELDETYQINKDVSVTPITANHCPGAAIFLFQYENRYTLHCGDFRVNREILNKLAKFQVGQDLHLDSVYLDTTYCKPVHNFPKQETVSDEVSLMFADLLQNDELFNEWFGQLKQCRITDFFKKKQRQKKKFLILVGTYVIGKENLAVAISKRLNCQIYVSSVHSRNDKIKILKSYKDKYLDSVLTTNELGDTDCSVLVHLVPMKIAGNLQELSKYFNHNSYFEHFERCVGLRPTGWTFGQTGKREKFENFGLFELSRMIKKLPTFSYKEDVLEQGRRITSKVNKSDHSLYRIYSLPYSEHSSFRELSYFCIFLQIKKIIPTVNIGNEKSIQSMNGYIKLWELAREKLLQNEPPFNDIKLESF